MVLIQEDIDVIFMKPKWMDKEWTRERDIYCPYCRTKKWLYRDDNSEMEATHYCVKCAVSLSIVDGCKVRGNDIL